MASKGAQPGNQNARKGRVWRDAINRALKKREREQRKALDDLAEELLKQAEAGDLMALKELADRVEGRPEQPVKHSGDDDEPIKHVFKTVVETKKTE